MIRGKWKKEKKEKKQQSISWKKKKKHKKSRQIDADFNAGAPPSNSPHPSSFCIFHSRNNLSPCHHYAS